MSSLRISGERATDLLRDGSEVTKHSRLGAVLDRRGEEISSANSAGEVVDVELRQPIVANSVETVTLRCRLHLFDNLVLEIVDDVAVPIDYHATVGAEDSGTTRAPVELESVTALSLPDDALAALEYERRFLRVGELPVVGVVKTSAR